jgi:hypothetical protein
VDREDLLQCVGAYRELRRVRAEMVCTFGELLTQVDQLERFRAINLEQLKRRGRPPSC